MKKPLLIIWLLCLLFAWLLVGCSTPVLPHPYVGYIPRRAVSISLFMEFDAYASTGALPNSPDRPTDNIYFCPTQVQLREMDLAVNPLLHRTYIAEAWDCDDMAWEWRVLCHRWAVEKVTKGRELPIAVFVCYAEVKSEAFDGRLGFAGHHALGLLCDSSGVWWYVEPKLGYHVKCAEAKFEGSIRCYKIVW
jgi:hypothetical protein